MATNTKRITLVLPYPMLRALKVAGIREGRPQSKIIRQALAEYLGVPDTVQYGGIFGDDEPAEEDPPAAVTHDVT